MHPQGLVVYNSNFDLGSFDHTGFLKEWYDLNFYSLYSLDLPTQGAGSPVNKHVILPQFLCLSPD
jgi:hypothetical protein